MNISWYPSGIWFSLPVKEQSFLEIWLLITDYVNLSLSDSYLLLKSSVTLITLCYFTMIYGNYGTHRQSSFCIYKINPSSENLKWINNGYKPNSSGKTASSINGIGKTGQLYVKEANWTALSHHLQK